MCDKPINLKVNLMEQLLCKYAKEYCSIHAENMPLFELQVNLVMYLNVMFDKIIKDNNIDFTEEEHKEVREWIRESVHEMGKVV